MKLTVIGCSPAWPNPGSAHSGYLVEGTGRLLLDCGPGVLARLREREPWPAIDAIVVTHFHLDHVGDLVPWLWGYLRGPGNGVAPPQLWLPPGGRAELAQLSDRFDDVFAIREYATGEPFEAAGFTITARAMRHYDPTAHGLRVSDGHRTLAYSGDTGPTPALVEIARDVDVFLCEATLDEPIDSTHDHLTTAEALEAAGAAGARRVVLTHRPVELPAPDGCEVARDGFELVL